MPSMRPARARLLATGAVVIAALAVVGLPAVTSSAAPADDVQYALTQPLCSAPADPSAMRCYGLKRVPVARGTRGAAAVRPAVAHGPAGGFTPQTLATAYGFDPKLNRSSLTVGIVLWHDAPNVLGDLNAFDKRYGLPHETSTSFRKVNEQGRTSPLPVRDRGAAGEIALDTQAVRAVCNTCKILLVEADDAYDDDLANAVNTAVRLGATIVTNSYGTPERSFSTKMKDAFYHPGVAIVASTGDDGFFGWDYANDPNDSGDGAASFPATSPFVIAVGGTTLHVDAAGHRTSETVWNSNGAHDATGSHYNAGLGASGGGCSKYFPAPPWQSHANGYAQATCHGHRLAADVSVVADPATGFDVYDSYGSGGWVTIGGTSLSAPLVAGMYALSGGSRGARFPATALYSNANAFPIRRFDVTAGGNGYCSTDGMQACTDAVYNSRLLNQTHNPNKLGLGTVDCSFPRSSSESVPRARNNECSAAVGYDGPSGIGTPRAVSLFVRTDPTVSILTSSAPHGRNTAFRTRVSEPLSRTYVTRVIWSWGDGKSTTNRSTSTGHSYARKGRYTLRVTVDDSRYQTTVATRTITVR